MSGQLSGQSSGELNLFLVVSAGLCFIIIIIISILNFFRISKIESERDDLQMLLRSEANSNIRTLMKHNNSNLTQDLVELENEMKSDINNNITYIVENQKNIDSNQNVLIDKNELHIFNIDSNITNNIEPKMLVFDGRFTSLETNVNDNNGKFVDLSRSISSHSALINQLSNQIYDSSLDGGLKSNLDAILAMEFGTQIYDLSVDIRSDIRSNEQARITGLNRLDDKYFELSNLAYDTASNLDYLSTGAYGLASVVQAHISHD
jgi:hypothetical protein